MLFGGVHSVLRHIGVELFAVLLLLGLNVVEGLSGGGIGELKHAHVVKARGVLFRGEHIGAEESVDIPRLLVGIANAGAPLVVFVLQAGGHLRNGALKHLVDGIEMLFFGHRHLAEQIFQLGRAGVAGVFVILLPAEALLAPEILKQGGFLWS